MDWIFKAAITAGAVLVVAAAARHLGQRAAGVVAALPIVTAPTLAWVSQEQGVGFAVSAAVGGVSASAIMAMFALAYARGCRHGGIATALACGLAGALAMATPAMIASARLVEALALALVCCAVALVLLPAGRDRACPARQSPLAPVAVAVVAGSLAAVAARVGPELGGFATGLLSSLPLIGGGAAIHAHATGGPRAAEQLLHGYVRGLLGKTAFGAVFALLAVQVGAPAALLLASVTACMLSHSLARPWPEVPSQRRSD